MTLWEYNEITTSESTPTHDVNEHWTVSADRLGQDGWELVSVFGHLRLTSCNFMPIFVPVFTPVSPEVQTLLNSEIALLEQLKEVLRRQESAGCFRKGDPFLMDVPVDVRRAEVSFAILVLRAISEGRSVQTMVALEEKRLSCLT